MNVYENITLWQELCYSVNILIVYAYIYEILEK